ncbi:MAG: T9SS type A sorting domain-containing protein [Bacteroidetes bacterium]|nr:T9SS type A sorting domain-containing protein [Bacteroidota bacterium]
MIRKYFYGIFPIVIAIFFAVPLVAQTNFNQPNKFIAPKVKTNSDVNKATSCIDIIQYPQSKASNILLDTMDYITYIGAVSQTYYYAGNGLVHGINVYMTLDLDGIPGNKDSVKMVISVRNIDAGNVPTTTLGSDTVFLHDVGFTTQDLMFSSPIAVTDSFAVVVEIDTLNPSNPYYATNDYGDGAVEQLSALAYTGIWYNLYPTWSGTWDVDMMLSPIFEDLVVPNYSVDTNSVCIGNPITFTNNSSIVYNTMFNTGKATFSLDIDEFPIIANLDSNYTHVYANAGVHNTNFEIIQYGYTLNCIIDSTMPVTVLDTSSANFNFNNLGSGAYQFTDASLNGTTYYWDFGDGDTSTTQSPTHTFLLPANYNVCLTVVNDSACGSSQYCQTVSFVIGQKEMIVSNEVKIYPIPAKRFFTVEIPTTFFEPTIVVTDIVGKKIIAMENIQQSKVKVLTEELNSGVYFVSVSSNGQKVFTKRIVVDK